MPIPMPIPISKPFAWSLLFSLSHDCQVLAQRYLCGKGFPRASEVLKSPRPSRSSAVSPFTESKAPAGSWWAAALGQHPVPSPSDRDLVELQNWRLNPSCWRHEKSSNRISISAGRRKSLGFLGRALKSKKVFLRQGNWGKLCSVCWEI